MYLLIFDLDGTIVDSKQDLIDSVNATRGFMNMSPLPGAAVARYVGRGAMALIQSSLGESAPAADVKKALDFFIQYYGEHMLDKTTLYDGVHESLRRVGVLTETEPGEIELVGRARLNASPGRHHQHERN